MKSSFNTFKLLLILTLTILIDIKSNSQTKSYPSNIKYDSIICSANPNFIYCIYLPPSYSKTKKLPILFVNEPAGRASLAIDSFLVAAKKHNYIVASSYNSKNGDQSKLFEATDIMMEDAFEKFNINTNRVYLAGFSGGSRGAISTAFLMGDLIKGVIGCGAGFPGNRNFYPIKNSNFSYYGIVGDRDMNLLDMTKFEDYLSKQNIAHKFRYFNGGHNWPNSKLLTEAMDWLEIQAINKKLKLKNNLIINESFKETKLLADNYLIQGDFVDAIRVYQYIVQDFEQHYNTKYIVSIIDSILLLSDYQELAKIKQEDFHKEEKLINQVSEKIRLLNHSINFTDDQLNWWINKIDSFNTKKDKLINQRILSHIRGVCIELGSSQLSFLQYKKAENLFFLWTILEPENKYAHFNLARAYAFQSKNRKSLKSLEYILDLGGQFIQSAIIQDEAFKNLKNNKNFIKITAKTPN